jgi:hypothetical protein
MIVGFALSCYGFIGYSTLNPAEYRRPSNRFGMAIFSSWYVDVRTSNAAVDIWMYDIRTETESITLQIRLHFRTNQNVSEKVLFGFQVPYNFTDLSVDVLMSSTETGQGQGGDLRTQLFLNSSRGFDAETGLDYFWGLVNSTMSPGKHFDEFTFNATMTLNSALFRKSYTTYELQSQFDLAPESQIRTRVPGQMISIFNPTNSRCLLNIVQPSNSQMQSSPSADELDFSNGETWHVWDVSRRSTLGDFFSIGILSDFEIVDLVQERENTIFQSSLFLGVGIPTLISSVLELLKVGVGGRQAEMEHKSLVDLITQALRKNESPSTKRKGRGGKGRR